MRKNAMEKHWIGNKLCIIKTKMKTKNSGLKKEAETSLLSFLNF